MPWISPAEGTGSTGWPDGGWRGNPLASWFPAEGPGAHFVPLEAHPAFVDNEDRAAVRAALASIRGWRRAR